MIMLVIFQLLQGFGYYGFGTLAGTVLVARGYTITQSLLYSALTSSATRSDRWSPPRLSPALSGSS